MRQVLLIASITVREAIRRKVWLWMVVMVVGLIVIDWATMYAPAHERRMERVPGMEGVDLRMVIALFFGMNIILFLSSIISVVLSAGQITGERDRGVLSTILAKPLSRFHIYLGKWLGVCAFSCATIVLALIADWAVLVGIYGGESGSVINWGAIGVMLLYPVLYTTLTLAWSTFANMAVSLLMTATLYSMTFIGDTIVQVIAELTDNKALKQLWILSKWIIPHQRLGEWRMSFQEGFGAMFHEVVGHNITVGDKAYVLAYIVGVFLFGYMIFARRDVQ